MAQVPVRVIGDAPFKGTAPGGTLSMSLRRSRQAVAAGQVELIGSKPAAKKAVKKTAAKKAPAKKAVAGTRNRSMRGKTTTK